MDLFNDFETLPQPIQDLIFEEVRGYEETNILIEELEKHYL